MLIRAHCFTGAHGMTVKFGGYPRDFPPLLCPAVLSVFYYLLFSGCLLLEVISLKCVRLDRELELKVAVFVQDDGAPALSRRSDFCSGMSPRRISAKQAT